MPLELIRNLIIPATPARPFHSWAAQAPPPYTPAPPSESRARSSAPRSRSGASSFPRHSLRTPPRPRTRWNFLSAALLFGPLLAVSLQPLEFRNLWQRCAIGINNRKLVIDSISHYLWVIHDSTLERSNRDKTFFQM